jgi:hypothetical protein
MKAHMSRRPTDDRGIGFTISQIISALDDRNVVRAMRLLEPGVESSDLSARNQDDAPRCVRCVTRGE